MRQKHIDRAFLQLFDVLERLRDVSLETVEEEEIDRFLSLNARQIKVLVAVTNMTQKNPEGISLKALAERLKMPVPATSLLVDAMVKNGHLMREASTEDRRAIRIKLTKNGQKAFNNMRTHLLASINELLVDISDEKLNAFIDVIDILHKKIYHTDE